VANGDTTPVPTGEPDAYTNADADADSVTNAARANGRRNADANATRLRWMPTPGILFASWTGNGNFNASA